MKFINDPKFLNILEKQSKEFVLSDRKELLKILELQGVESLKAKLNNDIAKARF